MPRLVLVTLLVLSLLFSFVGAAAATSDQASERACVGQYAAAAAQSDGLRPLGLKVVSPAAHEPGFGDEQSDIAVRCDPVLLAKRYQI